MKKFGILALCLLAAMLFASNAFSAGDLSKQKPIVVRVDLGKSATEKHTILSGSPHVRNGEALQTCIAQPQRQ